MVTVRAIVGDIAGLVGVALRSFFLTLLLLLFLGVVLSIASFWVFSGMNQVYGAIAGLIALLECIAAGVLLGAKRSVAVTLVHALDRYHVGSSTARLIFGRLLGVSAENPHGERGGWAAQTVERLPLAQAEERLGATIQHVLRSTPEERGVTAWLRCRVQSRLVQTVGKLTLARFREEDARHGGVDLVKVQDDLGTRIDQLLVGKLRGGINLWTILVLVGLPTQILVTDYLVLALLK